MAARAAATIKKELELEVETIVGGLGEFTVWLNGQKLLSKLLLLPSEKKILSTLREKLSKDGAHVSK